jgi:hypothetical protein
MGINLLVIIQLIWGMIILKWCVQLFFNRQHRHADAGLARGIHDALREFGRMRVAAAVLRVVHIVEVAGRASARNCPWGLARYSVRPAMPR